MWVASSEGLYPDYAKLTGPSSGRRGDRHSGLAADRADVEPREGATEGVQFKYQARSVRIAPELFHRRFDVHFRYGPATGDATPEEATIGRHYVEFRYVDFLDQLNQAFGASAF